MSSDNGRFKGRGLGGCGVERGGGVEGQELEVLIFTVLSR